MQAFAKDVGLPQLDRVIRKICQQAAHQIFALLLGAHNGADLGVDGGLHHVDGRRTGFQPDAVAPAPVSYTHLLAELLPRLPVYLKKATPRPA